MFGLYFAVQALAPRLPSDEERLLELLFDGYNPSARPVLNSSHTVEVRMQFSLLQIQDLVSVHTQSQFVHQMRSHQPQWTKLPVETKMTQNISK